MLRLSTSLPMFASLLLALPLTAAASPQAEPVPAAAPAPPALPAAPHDPAYDKGMRAMDEARWTDAVADFDQAIAAHPGSDAAALYWKAYSLQKLGRSEQASATCDQLIAAQPPSSWNKECLVMRAQSRGDLAALRALNAQERAADRVHVKVSPANVSTNVRVYTYDDGIARGREPIDPDDDLKIIALNAIMQQEPAKALPVLHSLIFSSKPLELRRRALFVLERSKLPEAQAMVVEAAGNKTDPTLQRIAIQDMSVSRGKDAIPQLLAIYRGSSDTNVKRAALNGLFIAKDAPDLVELARGEKDLPMKREIVTQLSIMKDPAAIAYMEELLK